MQFLRQLKSARCLDCGAGFPPVAMDFDHRKSETKRDNVSRIAAGPEFSMADLKAEISKCELVCANCHRIRTWKTTHEKDCRIAFEFGAIDYQI